MIATLIEPFSYRYMTNAIWVSALVGAVCAFLSAYFIRHSPITSVLR